MRKQVTVYSTVGQKKDVVSVEGSVWSQVRSELSAAGVDVNGMQAVIGESQVSLESPQAQVPDSDFTLFLLPQKVKSGYSPDDEDDCGCDDDEEDEDDSSLVGQIKGKIREIGANVNDLYSMVGQLEQSSVDPKIQELKSKAEQLKRDLGLWD